MSTESKQELSSRGSLLLRLERILLFEKCDAATTESLKKEFLAYHQNPRALPIRMDEWINLDRVPWMSDLESCPQFKRHAGSFNLKPYLVADFEMETPVHAFLVMTWFPLAYPRPILNDVYDMLTFGADASEYFNDELDENGVKLINRFLVTHVSISVVRKLLVDRDFSLQTLSCSFADQCILCRTGASRHADADQIVCEILGHHESLDYLETHSLFYHAAKDRLHKTMRMMMECMSKKQLTRMNRMFLSESVFCQILKHGSGDETVEYLQRRPSKAAIFFASDDELARVIDGVTYYQNTLSTLIRNGVDVALLLWLIPRFSCNILNGYDMTGKTPLMLAVERKNYKVVNGFLKESWERVDFTAEEVDILSGPCLPYLPVTFTGKTAWELSKSHSGNTAASLQFSTKYQENIYYPERVQMIEESLMCLPAVVVEIILEQSHLPMPQRIDKSEDEKCMVGQKRKRDD